MKFKTFKNKNKIGINAFTGKFYGTFIIDILQIVHNLSEKEREHNTFETGITLILKPNKDIIRKENYRPISVMD